MTGRDFRQRAAMHFRGVRALRQRASEIDYVAVAVATMRSGRERTPRDRARVFHEQLHFLREQSQPLMAAREEAADMAIMGARSV